MRQVHLYIPYSKLDIFDYKRKRVETVITIAVAFIIVSGLYYWKHSEILIWPLIVAAVIAGLGLAIYQLGLYITIGWFKMTQAIGWVTSKVILTILYFLFITPYALVLKVLSKKDVLKSKDSESLFVSRNQKYSAKDLENPW